MTLLQAPAVRLPNGVTLRMAPLDHALSASLGVWVGAGSRHEPNALAGAHHFIEHMLFRGTVELDGPSLARLMDGLGGRANAFTTKDATCYYMDLLEEDLHEGIRLLAAMVSSPSLRESDLVVEKKIIQQEMRTASDVPADLARELCLTACWGEHPLARPILGRPETVEALSATALREVHTANYTGENVVVVVAGRFDPEQVEAVAREAFTSVRSGAPRELTVPPDFCAGIQLADRPWEQAHVFLAIPGVAATSTDLPALNLIGTVLAGGFGSRLFQEIRERRGWAYRLDSAALANVDVGLFSVYMAVDPDHAADAAALVVAELHRLADGDLGLAEIERARKRTIRRLIMGAEATRSQMFRLGRQGLSLGRSDPPEETIRYLQAMTIEELRQRARTLLRPDRVAIGAAGPVKAQVWERVVNGG